ncbi:MAG TPA: HAD-IC family P-type ATPase, partial [Adhaeribacter sp.]|nr:HAD-IC family P-type ATPase [Adhaeribacter sp.]
MGLDQKFPFYSIGAEETLKKLEAKETGLPEAEVKKRRKEYGPNELTGTEGVNPVLLFLKQFKDFLILVLVLAAGVAWYAGQMVDVYVIAGVILFNAILGFAQEYRAEKAIEALKKMIKHETNVLRDGKLQTVQASELVPGDIVKLEEGDSVPADARLLKLKNLRTIEASLTGESLPIDKQLEEVPDNTSLGDRLSMIWKGTHVARGTATAVVTATGANTELGKISESLGNIKTTQTNFRKKTARLGKQMAVLSIVTSIVVFLTGYYWRGFGFEDTLLVTVATLVSSIPEGLPAVISIVLAIGASRMAKQNAIVREFTATEMLGSVTVILSDKTGTITQSILTVKKIFLGSGQEVAVTGSGYGTEGGLEPESEQEMEKDHPVLLKLLQIARYSNNARLNADGSETAETETETESRSAKRPSGKAPAEEVAAGKTDPEKSPAANTNPDSEKTETKETETTTNTRREVAREESRPATVKKEAAEKKGAEKEKVEREPAENEAVEKV